MSAQLLAAKTVIEEEQPTVRQIPTLSTSLAGFVGITERGRLDTPVLCTKPSEYQAEFGGYVSGADLPHAIDGWFTNGGGPVWVVRTCHHTDITDKATVTAALGTLTLNDRAGTPVPTLRVDGKTKGAYANALKVNIAAPSSGAAAEFDLTVQKNGVTVERFANLSMLDTAARYVETIINDATNGSLYIAVVDLDSATVAPNDRPALGLSAALSGGSDGLTSLADTDFVGSAAGGTAMHALDQVQDLRLLAIPGQATSTIHNAMITYCEVTRDQSCFAVLDPPSATSATGMVTYVTTTAAINELSEFGGIYWPRVKVSNPSKSIFGSGDSITVPPSGHVAGVMARTDGARVGGVYDPPAGIERGKLFGVIGFETDETLDESKRDLVFPKLVNPLTVFTGAPRHIDGARTLKSTGNFPTIGERRGVINIEQSIKAGLLFARHTNNDENLRSTCDRSVRLYLRGEMKVGAFASQDPDTAFFVDFDVAGKSFNNAASVKARKLIGRIGLATQTPAEFTILRFSQDTRAILAAAAA